MTATRGTSNSNDRGSSYSRKRRREWLIETYRADVDICDGRYFAVSLLDRDGILAVPRGQGYPACRCYRCGVLLTEPTVTVDRIKPGCQGGTYRRENIRPACADCNSETGGATRSPRRHQCPDCHQEDPEGKRRPRKLVQWSGIAKCATHTGRRSTKKKVA